MARLRSWSTVSSAPPTAFPAPICALASSNPYSGSSLKSVHNEEYCWIALFQSRLISKYRPLIIPRASVDIFPTIGPMPFLLPPEPSSHIPDRTMPPLAALCAWTKSGSALTLFSSSFVAASTSKFLSFSRASEKYFSASLFAENDESIRDSSEALKFYSQCSRERAFPASTAILFRSDSVPVL